MAAAAPDVPFYYYHIPSFTGVDLPVAAILRLALEKIPNLGGANYSHYNLPDFAACLEVDPKLEIFYGRDDMLLSALVLGGRSAVGSGHNFLAPVYHEMIAAYDRGDLATARKKQSLARRYVEVMDSFGGLRTMKAVLKWQGVDCGPWRAPLASLSAEEEEALRQVWDAVRAPA